MSTIQAANTWKQLPTVRVVAVNSQSGVYSCSIPSGIGATFTYTATGSLSIDSVTLVVGDLILFVNQTLGYMNGVWQLTSLGTSTSGAILTRPGFYQTIEQIKGGQYVTVAAGSIYAGAIYSLVEPFPFGIGVPLFAMNNNINFAASSAGGSDSLVPGGVVFAGIDDTLLVDQSNFYYDNVFKRVGIKTNTPAYTLDVNGYVNASSGLLISNSPAAPNAPIFIPGYGNFLIASPNTSSNLTYFYTSNASSQWVTRVSMQCNVAQNVGQTTFFDPVYIFANSNNTTGNGTLIAGNNSSISGLSDNRGIIEAINYSGILDSLIITRGFGSTANVSSSFVCKNARGTIASPTATQGSDILGGLYCYGYSTSAYTTGYAGVVAYAGATFYTGFNPMGLIFYNVNSSGTTSTEALRITSDNDVIVNGNNLNIATGASNGWLMINSCAGVPTGSPSAAQVGNGACPMVVNASGSQLYVYISGKGWKGVVLV